MPAGKALPYRFNSIRSTIRSSVKDRFGRAAALQRVNRLRHGDGPNWERDLFNNDPTSGVSGGSLCTSHQYVGSGGTGTFTQSGGANTIGNYLYLGVNAGDSGTYNLSNGQLVLSTTIG